MRILHVVETLHVGGLERVVIDLVREQIVRGNHCLVVCLFEKGALVNEIEAQGIPVETCSKQGGLDIAATKRLRGFIREFQANVVHSHNVICNYYAAMALMSNTGVLLVNTRHGIGDMPIKQNWLYGLSLLRTNRAVGVCNATSNMLRRQFPVFSRKIVTVRNGIVLDAYQKRSPKSHQWLTEQLSVPGDTMLVAIVARLNMIKNHSMLFRAFRLVLESVPGARLLVIGDGELRSVLEREVRRMGLKEKIIFLGDRRDVATLLSGVDLFVLSSLKEGYSISLLEACASALPLVATNAGGNSEIVQHNNNGLLVENGDVNSLADSIIAILTSDRKRQEYGSNSRAWVEREGTVRGMCRKYEAIYQGN
ncbi:glycosyltransferase [Thiolapillus sp.]